MDKINKILNKDELFQEYQMLLKMKSDIGVKIRMLSILLYYNNPNPWRVVGITQNALVLFKTHEFKKVPKMGINRAHLINRDDTYREMLLNPISSSEVFWEKYLGSDKTVFSTSSENLSKKGFSKIFYFENNQEILFPAIGYAWKHNNKEIEFLRKFHNNVFSNI